MTRLSYVLSRRACRAIAPLNRRVRLKRALRNSYAIMKLVLGLLLGSLCAGNAFRLAPFRSSSSYSALGAGKTLFDKIWEQHLVADEGGNSLIYIDRHLVHEVTSPQAFEGLRSAKRAVRRRDCTLVTVDHNVPTSDRSAYTSAETFIKESASRIQVMALEENVKDFGLTYFGLDDARQGIVHIIGPEQGFTLPGSTIVCGDSHTATHGAFGSLAFGIGTSEVEHVLATQTLVQSKGKNMRVTVKGPVSEGVTSKDIVLHVIGCIGTAGGTGHVIEFAGEAIQALSMEARMSICNMAIEGGARAGMVGPDETTFAYLKGRPMAPTGQLFEEACTHWRSLQSDPDAAYDKEVTILGADICPTVTWGTSPQDVCGIDGLVPDPAAFDASDPERASSMRRSLEYMGLTPGTKLDGLQVDKVFIGSCTNARIEDIREVARVAKGRHVAKNIKTAMVVPGSGLVKAQAELEGLDVVLKAAGFDWREPGCSMCLAMNPDKLEPQERCASTSNRNFEGRQGTGGRTHLVSPAMAAAAAVSGGLTDVRALEALGEEKAGVTPAQAALDAVVAAMTKKPTVAPAARLFSAAGSGAGAVGSSACDASKQFTVVRGVAAKLDIQNIDTDMIIPKQFLKTIKRSGLGSAAFFSLRYTQEEDGGEAVERPDFVLNQGRFRQTAVLIAGDNFGCGSSREHAPWAIKDFGIQAVVSTSFADIFYNNCFKNGMLPIILPREQVRVLMEHAESGGDMEVDLAKQQIRSLGVDGTDSAPAISFEVEPFRKHCLLNGLDDIGLTMQKMAAIEAFEARRSREQPWFDGASQPIS